MASSRVTTRSWCIGRGLQLDFWSSSTASSSRLQPVLVYYWHWKFILLKLVLIHSWGFGNIKVQYLLTLNFKTLPPVNHPEAPLEPSSFCWLAGSFLQVCYCAVPKENLMYTVKAMSTIVSFMQSHCNPLVLKIFCVNDHNFDGALLVIQPGS